MATDYDSYTITEPNKRLDEVVLEQYGSLQFFDKVLKANPSLINPVLSVGDVVNLPVIAIPKIEESLW